MMLAVDKRRGEAIGHIIDIGPREAPVMLLPVEDVVALEMEPDIDRAIHLDLCRDRNVWDGSNTAGCIDRIRLQCDLYSCDRANRCAVDHRYAGDHHDLHTVNIAGDRGELSRDPTSAHRRRRVFHIPPGTIRVSANDLNIFTRVEHVSHGPPESRTASAVELYIFRRGNRPPSGPRDHRNRNGRNGQGRSKNKRGLWLRLRQGNGRRGGCSFCRTRRSSDYDDYRCVDGTGGPRSRQRAATGGEDAKNERTNELSVFYGASFIYFQWRGADPHVPIDFIR